MMKDNTNSRTKSCCFDTVSKESVCKLNIGHGGAWAEEPRKAVHNKAHIHVTLRRTRGVYFVK